MEFVHQGLFEEHKRWIDSFSEEIDLFNDCVICITDVLNIHFSIIDYFLETGDGEIGNYYILQLPGK